MAQEPGPGGPGDPSAAGTEGMIQHLCRALSEWSPQPMVAVEGTTHVVVYANPAFARLCGTEPKDLVGRPFAEAVPEWHGHGCAALLDRVYRTGTHECLHEQEHRQPRAQAVYWSYWVWAILGPDGRPAGVMVQVTDSTETATYRRMAAAVNEALVVSATRQHELAEVADSLTARLQAAVAERDTFIAVLSHELRNPLAGFSNGLQLLATADRGPAATERSLGMMGRQLAQMVRLVDDLLDVSRMAAGKLPIRKQRVDLAKVVGDAVDATRAAMDRQGHELTVALPAEPVALDADPARLTQVFVNLLENAAKYSERGGRVRVAATREGAEAVVSVRDAGIGLPAADLARVFDLFVQVDAGWQRSQGGMGIGLSLVKQLVESHGGRVEARSAGLGAGSEFVVRLPCLAAPEGLAAAGGSAALGVPAPSAAVCRVLVVDDNRDAAESLAELIEALGHEARTAYGGAEAVAAAAEFRPRLILMDLGMPRVDGLEAARRIRSESWGGEPLLVAMTGWGAAEDHRRTREAGFDRHLVKPVGLAELGEPLAAALRSPQAV